MTKIEISKRYMAFTPCHKPTQSYVLNILSLTLRICVYFLISIFELVFDIGFRISFDI